MTIGSFSSHPASVQNAASDVYTDLNSLQKIKQMGRGDDADKQQALEAVAKQFESVFLNMMMKSMREANQAFEDESMSSNEMDFYQQMFDQQLALSLSKDGVGIADALVRQLQRQLPSSYSSQGTEKSANPFDMYSDIQRLMESSRTKVMSPKNGEAVAPIADRAKEDLSLSSPDTFIQQLYPMAEKAAAKLGVDPRALLSQAALETGWGQHMIKGAQGENSHNLFGIKANNGWGGEVATVQTLEYRNGIPQQQVANFRSYDSYQQSFDDYVEFIQSNGRYQKALDSASSTEDYLRQLQSAGYATDPNYANKILDIAERNFSKDDVVVEGGQG
ncbi:MAG: flagellar assembly peptidoglycan hydrolase FlgJ [Cellvibrionaceae bacterium]|nr:flagellar assembly peptidoglycan hydrolase FlgJ [Cellvibrionaceae bacterium]|tara:strand:- start:55195 stop:56193 length:999 start_codon:yes stop_codon:yes gene_type:complete